VQQHLAYWVGIATFALGGCAEGSQTFADDGGANTGSGPPTSSNGGNGGNGNGGAMTSSMGGDGPGPSTSTSTVTTTGGVMCGDDVCSGGEICSSCPADCGSCCPNGTCDPNETPANCAADCPSTCPDGTCEATETEASCPADCGNNTNCAHDPCITGGPLDPDECLPCALIVCANKPFCCILTWGSDCVAEAQGNPLCGC